MKRLCAFINFHEEDLENSMIAIEGFVLEHWHQLDQLQNKQDYEQVSEQFISRVARIAEKNKQRLKKRIEQSDRMMALLAKARRAELTDEEKDQMRNELILTLKTIPTFVIVSLPQRFLTLPILLKILPQNLFAGNSDK
ncbi:MAG: hypothetical protein HC859_02230 [Bacteroidia bacterium]|nr:hypothetical protein [Bacteroidia bacterium]